MEPHDDINIHFSSSSTAKKVHICISDLSFFALLSHKQLNLHPTPLNNPTKQYKSQCLTPRLPVALVSPTRKPRSKLRVHIPSTPLSLQPQNTNKMHTAHGEGAPNAPGHTEGKAPGQAPVASDSGVTNVGIDNGSNQPGEKGIGGVPVSTETTTNANMK